MKNAFDMFEVNEDLEKDGVWQDFSSFRVLLARSGGKNTEWWKQLSNEAKKAGKATFDSIETDEKVDIVRTVFCKAVIKKHQVKNEEGIFEDGVYIKEDNEVKVVPFNVENMKMMLEQLPEYFKKLQDWSDDYKVFQDEIEEDQIKN